MALARTFLSVRSSTYKGSPRSDFSPARFLQAVTVKVRIFWTRIFLFETSALKLSEPHVVG